MMNSLPNDYPDEKRTDDDLRQSDPDSTPDSKESPDPFDPARYRLGQDFGVVAGVKKVVTTVPARKPNRHEFIRVRPGENWRLETGLFEDKLNQDIYLVDRPLWPELAGEIYPAVLYLAISRQGNVFIWPCKLPGPDGRSNSWNDSAIRAANVAESKWVRVSSNRDAGIYECVAAAEQLSGPEWPDLSFQDLFGICFRGRCIDTLDHPVLRALRGEV